MMKRNGIVANNFLSTGRRLIAATPMVVALTATLLIVLANVAASGSRAISVSSRTVDDNAQKKTELARNNAQSSLQTSLGALVKINVILDREPHSTFSLTGYGGKAMHLIIGESAWDIVCQIDNSGRFSVEIIELENLPDTNRQIIEKRFVDGGRSIFGGRTGRMSPAPFRVELEGIKYTLTTLGRSTYIGNDLEYFAQRLLGRSSKGFNAFYVGQGIDLEGECCVTCSGIRVCACSVEAPCGSCCLGSCCGGFEQTDQGGEKLWDVKVGEAVRLDVFELTIKLIQLEPTIVMEVTSPAIPNAKQLNYLDKTSMVWVIGDSRFEIGVVDSTKTGAHLR